MYAGMTLQQGLIALMARAFAFALFAFVLAAIVFDVAEASWRRNRRKEERLRVRERDARRH